MLVMGIILFGLSGTASELGKTVYRWQLVGTVTKVCFQVDALTGGHKYLRQVSARRCHSIKDVTSLASKRSFDTEHPRRLHHQQ